MRRECGHYSGDGELIGVCSFVGSVAGTPRKEGEEWEAKKSSYTVCTRSDVMVLECWALPGRSRNASD